MELKCGGVIAHHSHRLPLPDARRFPPKWVRLRSVVFKALIDLSLPKPGKNKEDHHGDARACIIRFGDHQAIAGGREGA
jgi:hypothetical protein